MNLQQEKMMNAPSLLSRSCVICGKPATNKHHIIPRSQGGTTGPVISVCGLGDMSGCHMLFHNHRLHMRYDGTYWWLLKTDEPTKYDDALSMPGWERIGVVLW